MSKCTPSIGRKCPVGPAAATKRRVTLLFDPFYPAEHGLPALAVAERPHEKSPAFQRRDFVGAIRVPTGRLNSSRASAHRRDFFPDIRETFGTPFR